MQHSGSKRLPFQGQIQEFTEKKRGGGGAAEFSSKKKGGGATTFSRRLFVSKSSQKDGGGPDPLNLPLPFALTSEVTLLELPSGKFSGYNYGVWLQCCQGCVVTRPWHNMLKISYAPMLRVSCS